MQASKSPLIFWKRLWQGLVFLTLLSLLVNLAQSVLWQNVVRTERIRYLSHAQGDPQILIIGNSHLGYSIQKDLLENALGVEVGYLQLGGIQINEAYALLEEALKSSNPQLVVLETFLWDPFPDTGTYELLYPDFWHALPALIDTYPPEDILNGWFPFIQNHGNWLYNPEGVKENIHLLLQGYDEQLSNEIDAIKYGGYIVGIIPTEEFDNVLGQLDPMRTYPDSPQVLMQRFQALCQREGCDLLLMKVPTVDSWGVYDASIAVPAQELGLPFADMNVDMGTFNLRPVHVFNASLMPEYVSGYNSHLNNAGSLVASLKLAQVLGDQLGITPDPQVMDYYRLFLVSDLLMEPKEKADVYTLVMADPQAIVDVSWTLETSDKALNDKEIITTSGISFRLPHEYNDERFQLCYTISRPGLGEELGISYSGKGCIKLVAPEGEQE